MSNQISGFAQGSAIPFKTQDAILANCLRAAGFTETLLSPLVVYDADILFKAGGGIKDRWGKTIKPSRYAGLNLVAAARRAHKEGQRGRVEYHFNHHPDLRKFCQIYRDQCTEIEEGEKVVDAAQRMESLMFGMREPDLDVHPRERLFRILCIALKLRVEYVNRWIKQTPYLVIKDSAAARTEKLPDGGKLEFHAGGKMVPISAPDQTFKNLGLI